MEVAYAAEAGATTAAVLLDAARVAPHLNAVAPALTCPDGGQAGRDLGVSELVAAAAAAASAVAAAQAAAAAAAAAFRGAKGYLPPLSPLSRVRRGPYCGRHDGLREPGPTNLRTHRFRARTGGQRGRTGTDAAGTGRRASAPVARAPGSSKVRLREEGWSPTSSSCSPPSPPQPLPTRTCVRPMSFGNLPTPRRGACISAPSTGRRGAGLSAAHFYPAHLYYMYSLTLPTSSLPHIIFRKRELTAPPAR